MVPKERQLLIGDLCARLPLPGAKERELCGRNYAIGAFDTEYHWVKSDTGLICHSIYLPSQYN